MAPAASSPRLIGRPVPDTPGTTSRPGRRRAVPDDLLRQASRRLEILALTASVLWVLGPLLAHLALHATDPGNPRWAQFGDVDYIAAASVVVSLALFAYLRAGNHDPARVMDLGLLYMVATAFALGVLLHLTSASAAMVNVNPMITWIGPVILMFAAIVPAAPGKMLVASLLAASMDPVGMLIARAVGREHFDSLGSALVMHYPNYLLVGVAVVISHVVTRLGQQVGRARELGSYRLGELLGRGGMGEVYQATHRMLARPAAIKLIRPEVLAAYDGETAQMATTRFRREAEAAARLRSPHTVELYDFGVTEDETLYFVMELLEGLDLESLVREHGPLPQRRVVHVLRQACESLEEAHAIGLVHRDIKPANIHLGRVGLRHDFVKLLDFGLVKSLGQPGTDATLATAADVTPGTPAYMAPEMAVGESVDGRADLYALGCVGYFLLTGRLVFEADSGFQMVARHLRAEPIPPSRRAEVEVAPALEALILRCLAKDPAHRPMSARELDGLLAEVGLEPWTEEEAARWWDLRVTPPPPG